MMDNKRAVLITGCSSGIGKATAVYLAENGYLVFAGVRKSSDAESLWHLGQTNLVPVCPLDLRKTDQLNTVKKAVEEELEKRGIQGLYALINNAGGGCIAPLEVMELEKMRAEMETRILGPIALLQEMLPLIRKGSGRVLWIQTPALMPIAFDFSIHGCDFASNCLSRTLQQELLPWGIPSIQIRCGGIQTPSVERCYVELEKSMKDWALSGKSLYTETLKKAEKDFRDFDKKRSEPELVAKTVGKALQTSRPKRRYHAGYMSGISAVMECIPQPIVDKMLSNR